MNSRHDRERRRHVRVEGAWPVTAHGVEHTGAIRTFAATMLNVSLSGVLLEAAITANLWADKPLTIDLPGGVGATAATVRRFVDYGHGGTHTSRWGAELTALTVLQRALWGRFVYTAAHQSRHPLAEMPVRITASPPLAPSHGARAASYTRRRYE